MTELIAVVPSAVVAAAVAGCALFVVRRMVKATRSDAGE